MSSQDTSFPRLVSLACHDLRTPLATIFGFARTIQRAQPEGEQLARYVDMIVAASTEMTALLEELSTAARIEDGRYEPALAPADTLELAAEAVPGATGDGATVETDASAAVGALAALAACARKHGGVESVAAEVEGSEVRLSPIDPGCAAVITGEQLKDLGAAVAGRVLGALGADVQLEGTVLRISFAADGSGS
jgi:signal transduction histidine kinase